MANRSRPSVYVRPIPPGVRGVDLREKFRPFGDIKDIYQPLDHRTRTVSLLPFWRREGPTLLGVPLIDDVRLCRSRVPQPRNYAYIEFVNVEDAERAILDAHNTDLKG